MFGAFRNEPLTNFSDPSVRQSMERTLESVAAQFDRRYPLVLSEGGAKGQGEIASTDPSDAKTVVGRVAKASQEDIETALRGAWKTAPVWGGAGAPFRARVLVKAAQVMRRRRLELDAWEVFEAGKPWIEADADVAEAIDFLEYYARQAVRLAQPVGVTQLPGEEDEAFYIPLGVGAVIPPWNFPLAILTGMTSGAIVAGNPVLLKPASPTAVIGAKFMEVMAEAGLPEGVVQFVPGDGGEIGDYIVTHPKIRFVSFTGSREVGLRVNAKAAEHQKGQRWIKRVVAEMGGKDAILVDADADPVEAARGIAAAAFGYQGQKCSACSRAIVVGPIYDQVAKALAGEVAALHPGHPRQHDVTFGPVINAQGQEKIQGFIDEAKRQFPVVAEGPAVPSAGYFVRATVFGDVDPRSRLGQEEVFGPVLALMRAKDFDEGLAIVNDTEYGLTGALYSGSRLHIEKARREFHAGNLYINRKCTGAMVGAHPFGGFDMSGTDSKTGSPDYLLLFMQMKAVAEAF